METQEPEQSPEQSPGTPVEDGVAAAFQVPAVTADVDTPPAKPKKVVRRKRAKRKRPKSAAKPVATKEDFPRTIEEAKERAGAVFSEAGHEIVAAVQEPAMNLLAHYFGMGKAIVEGAIDGAVKARNRGK